ncbi:MAG: antiterminator LoaP [Spirochaetia bacterium]|nr:antiterminator LoaP [Spirochaetia bacterium]
MLYWYAIQTYSGNEDLVKSKINKEFLNYKTFLPKRELEIRKSGVLKKVTRSLFPGYIFLQLSRKITYEEVVEISKKCRYVGSKTGILKFLGINISKNQDKKEITSVKKQEIDFILSLTEKGEVITFSKYIKEGSKVKVLEGPLKGKEVIVKKINPRKKRITVEFYMLGKKHNIDLGGSLIKELDMVTSV